MKNENGTPATAAEVAADIRFHADRLGAHLASNNERTHDAASHGLSVAELAMTLTAKAAALDAIVDSLALAACACDFRDTVRITVCMRCAILSAAKAAQVSK